MSRFACLALLLGLFAVTGCDKPAAKPAAMPAEEPAADKPADEKMPAEPAAK